MSEPIVTPQHRCTCTTIETKEWSYDEILELFPDGDGSLVNPLVRRCQKYEAEIARMTSALECASAKCLRLTRSQLTGEPVAYVYGCDAFGVGVLSSRHWTPVDAIEAALKRLKKEES